MRDTVRFYCFDDNSMDGDGYSNLLRLFADLEKSGVFDSPYHEFTVIHITVKLGERRLSYGIPICTRLNPCLWRTWICLRKSFIQL